MKGKQIKSLLELHAASITRKAVVGWNSSAPDQPRPAAFVFSMPARWVHIAIMNGLYIYKGKVKK